MKFSSSHLSFHLIKFFTIFTLLFMLASCSKNQNQTIISPTLTGESSPSQNITLASPTPPIEITPIPTITPQLENSPALKETGIIIFSMSDGLYTHLFAYNPYNLPPTRLTGYSWDDQDPAISPDGTQIAFTSNRDGNWEIYVLNLRTDSLLRVTNNQTYDGSPAWSPDGQYIIYQTLNGNNLDLVIQSIADPNSVPIQLTAESGNNYSPSWSTDGRQIAFVTDRNGFTQIWLADLQKPDDRYTIITTSSEIVVDHPVWSPDGKTLAWCVKDLIPQIMTASVENPSITKTIGTGCSPAWSPDGKTLLAVYDQPNTHYLTGYDSTNSTLTIPMIPFSENINSLDWKGGEATSTLSTFLNLQQLTPPEPLFTSVLSLPQTNSGRKGIVELSNLNVENAYLADSTDESFYALRQALGQKIGWDFLNTLDNAYLPISAPASPGISQNWLFTGRAIAVNSVPLDANWMVVSREDYDGETYWRVWLKCVKQDGSCGVPIQSPIWDFSSRFSGDTTAYENGGKLTNPPDGYWFDFTEFAHRFGWERLPAQNNWRYYLNGALFNVYVFRQGESWQQAMLEIYPPEALKAAGYASH